MSRDLIDRIELNEYIKAQRGRPFIGITLEEAILMMISEVPSAQPEERTETHSCDLISRQDAINVLDVLCQEHRYKIPGKRETYSQYNEAWQDALDRAEGAIGNLPSAEPERKKGKWIPHEGGKFVGFPYMHYECSECRAFEPTETNFCPNCGADMRGGEEDGKIS